MPDGQWQGDEKLRYVAWPHGDRSDRLIAKVDGRFFAIGQRRHVNPWLQPSVHVGPWLQRC